MEETLEGLAEAPLAVGRWVIDPVHSQVGFTVIDSADLKIIGGRFTDFSGEILVDDDSKAIVSGALKVASLSTDEDERDQDLRSADYQRTLPNGACVIRSDAGDRPRRQVNAVGEPADRQHHHRDE
jgi:hypothetical protein